MCGRFAMQMSGDEFERFLDPEALGATLFAGEVPETSLDIKPTDQVTVLIADQKQPGVLRLEPARWAL
ncbi:MAG TPA: hypothetical protein VLZ31_06405, partial [Microbacteriaceae bacterium]|nr:hypothetical protein [Microbacteriaceae bacterium]